MTRPPPRWSDRDIADARCVKEKMDELRRHTAQGTGGGWSEWCKVIPDTIAALRGVEASDFARIVAEKWGRISSTNDMMDAVLDLIAFVNSVLDLPSDDLS